MNYMISQNKAVKTQKVAVYKKNRKKKFKISLNKNQSKKFLEWNLSEGSWLSKNENRNAEE